MGLPLSVLLVEDDPDDHLIIKELLEDTVGYSVSLTWETSHQSGLRRLQDDCFDICLVDYKIGAATGLDFIAAASDQNLDIPFILITGVADSSVDLRAAEVGASDYFEKATMTGASLERAIRISIARTGHYNLRRTQQDLKRSHLEHELREAIERRQFEIYLQPEVHCETLEIKKAEALVRWNHPQKGTLSPHNFIDVAEQNGLIAGIGDCVLEQICHFSNRLHALGEQIKIAVNVSVAQIERREFADSLSEALALHGTDPSRIELEITESVAMRQSKLVRSHMDKLRQIGIKFAVDDFGTGHSGLATLKDFPFDVIKIDRSFVQTAEQNARSRAVAKTIFYLADVMRLETVAEGVETDAHFAFVKNYGATYAQGFMFSEPLNAEDFLTFLQQFNSRALAPAANS